MSEGHNEATIVVKKIVKGGGHHGGAWKVAYADFVTAMMAFFLLLWLLNVTTDEQRRGIADYFDPASISRESSGAGGVLGGLTVGSPGQLSSPSSRYSMDRSLPGRPEAAEDSNTLDEGAAEDAVDPESEVAEHPYASLGNEAEVEDLEVEDLNADEARELLEAIEEQQFEAAERQLREAIARDPELAELAENLLIDRTPEGLRIQIIDRDRYSMFPRSSARMYERTRQLLGLVARAIADMPNRLAISGHTDATPFAEGADYDNWDLSADRANESRRALAEAGVDPNRVARVVGLSDTDLLMSDDPSSPRNRRISIVLLRHTLQ